jgi:hypothetical protein
MENPIELGVRQAINEVDLAISETYRGQTELRERLENIQTVISTLPHIEKSGLNPRNIQEAQKKLKSIEETIYGIHKRVRKMEDIIKK